jgi:hypothetical protein
MYKYNPQSTDLWTAEPNICTRICGSESHTSNNESRTSNEQIFACVASQSPATGHVKHKCSFDWLSRGRYHQVQAKYTTLLIATTKVAIRELCMSRYGFLLGCCNCCTLSRVLAGVLGLVGTQSGPLLRLIPSKSDAWPVWYKSRLRTCMFKWTAWNNIVSTTYFSSTQSWKSDAQKDSSTSERITLVPQAS